MRKIAVHKSGAPDALEWRRSHTHPEASTGMSTRPPVGDWTSDFDHLDPAWVEDPHPIWDELRQTCPIAHTDRFGGVYFPSRYEDIRAVAYDTEHFSSRRGMVREGSPTMIASPPVTSDPPEHRAHRKVLLPVFTPDAAARFEPQTRRICRELIKRLSGKSGCDGATDYAQKIPVRVTAGLLGISEHAGDLFRRWVGEFFELGVTDPAVAVRVVSETRAFFGNEIAARRMAPSDDLISYLLDAEIDGQKLSDDHIRSTLRLLLFAGIDTTWSAIGACLWHLATHEDDQKRLVAEPALIPTAVEEFLRAYAPATAAREIVRQTDIGGCLRCDAIRWRSRR
jgi:cytochrome P450